MAVVVLSYRQRALIERVVEPLLGDPAATEVVVVVDGHQDGTIEWLREQARSDPRLIPVWQEHKGRAEAKNAGVRRSTADVLLFVDGDVVCAPGAVTGHAARHAGEQDLVVVGHMPTVIEGPRRAEDLGTIMYARQYEGHVDLWRDRPEELLQHFWGGFFSIRREDLERAGGSERPPLSYHADYEFGLRCHAAGLTGRFDPELRALHLHRRVAAQMFQDAFNQGRDRQLISPDQAPPSSRKGRFARSARILLGRPPVHPAGRAVAVSGAEAAGALGWWRVQERVVDAWAKVERQRGAGDARSEAISG